MSSFTEYINKNHPSFWTTALGQLIGNTFDTGLSLRSENSTQIGKNASLTGEITLGDDVQIAHHVTIGDGVKCADNVEIGPYSRLVGDVDLEEHVRLVHGFSMVEGDVHVGRHTNLTGRNRVVAPKNAIRIGNYCDIANYVTIRGDNHPTSNMGMSFDFYSETFGRTQERVSKGEIRIGHDVWIGTRSVILSGVEVGHGAVIGAGSVVVDDVEPFSVVAGNPTERIKYRFDAETREQLLDLEWWHWNEEKIRRNEKLFFEDLNELEDVSEHVR